MSRASVALPVRWSDVDLFGHMNNAAFLRFLDDARFAAFRGMVQVDRASGRPMPLSDEQRTTFARHTDDPPQLRPW